MIMVVVMIVCVFMAIKCKRTLGAGAEKGAVFRGAGDDIRRAFTAHVTVQTQHPIRGGHDHVQVVTYHDNRAPKIAADVLDLAIECCRPGLIKALSRFIQNQ
jgi:hypothetical protein